MNDQYSENLSWDEAQRMAYWECVEEDQPEEDLDKTDEQLQDYVNCGAAPH